MSDDVQFRFSTKTRIFIFIILGVAVFVALFIVLSPASPEQREAFTNFLLGMVTLEMGLMLYGLHRRFPVWRKFIESMTILTLFMAPVGLIVPLLLSYHVGMYYFLPAFLIGLNGWLFFAKHIIYGKNNWDENPTKKWTLVPWYILICGFFAGTIVLVVIAPHIPNWL